MNQSPTLLPVSVIIPSSGRVEELTRAIYSMISIAPPREVIIATDSALTSSTALKKRITDEFAGRFESFICVQSQGRSGPASTRNSALKYASSMFVAFLDDDDEFLPHKLNLQIDAMRKTGAIFSFSDYLRVGDVSQYMNCKPKSKKFKGNLARELAFDDCRIATPTVVLRTSFVRNLMPLFPEHLALREDNHAWLRVATTPGFSFIHIGEALVRVHVTGDSVQRGAKRAIPKTPIWPKEELEILKLAKAQGLRFPFLHVLRRTILKILVRLHLGFQLHLRK